MRNYSLKYKNSHTKRHKKLCVPYGKHVHAHIEFSTSLIVMASIYTRKRRRSEGHVYYEISWISSTKTTEYNMESLLGSSTVLNLRKTITYFYKWIELISQYKRTPFTYILQHTIALANAFNIYFTVSVLFWIE